MADSGLVVGTNPETAPATQAPSVGNAQPEGSGIPVGLAIDGANRHDMKLVRATLESIPVERPQPTPEAPQGLCLDR
jgi:hypothetical protein